MSVLARRHDGTSDLPLEFLHRDDDVIVKMNPSWWPNNRSSVLVTQPDRLALPPTRMSSHAWRTTTLTTIDHDTQCNRRR